MTAQHVVQMSSGVGSAYAAKIVIDRHGPDAVTLLFADDWGASMSVGYVDVDPITRRVVHHKLDQVGNNLTRTLAWCERHHEPVWAYGDGSFRCWSEDVTGHKQHLPEFGPDDHDIVAGPWEVTP